MRILILIAAMVLLPLLTFGGPPRVTPPPTNPGSQSLSPSVKKPPGEKTRGAYGLQKGEITPWEGFVERSRDRAKEGEKNSGGRTDASIIPVDKEDPYFKKKILGKLEVAGPDKNLQEELAELARKSSKELKAEVKKLRKSLENPFLAQLYDEQSVDKKTRAEVLRWLEEFEKDPQSFIKKADLFFSSGGGHEAGASHGKIIGVIDLGGGWVQLVEVFPNGRVALGPTEYVGPGNPQPLDKLNLPGKTRSAPTETKPEAKSDSEWFIRESRAFFERTIAEINAKNEKEGGPRLSVTQNVGDLDIVMSDRDVIGSEKVDPADYERLFGKEAAYRLKISREVYRNHWEKENFNQEQKPDKSINSETAGLLKNLQVDLRERVYDAYGGEKESQTGIEWPDDIPDDSYLGQRRDQKIGALTDLFDEYHSGEKLSDLLERDGLGFTFKALHQASPNNDIAIVDLKTGKYMWLDDYIQAGFPKKI